MAVCKVALTNGGYVLIDDSDYETVSRLSWCLSRSPSSKTDYAKAWDGNKVVYLHRLLMKAPDGIQVDHKNGNGLDNRRSNLRLATRSQNQANRGLARHNSSGFKGVYRDRERDGWISQIHFNGRKKHLGRFQTAVDAAIAFDRAASELYGEYAMTNERLGLL